MAREQHEIKAVLNLVDAVFDGDAGHGLGCSYNGGVVSKCWRVGNLLGPKAQVLLLALARRGKALLGEREELLTGMLELLFFRGRF